MEKLKNKNVNGIDRMMIEMNINMGENRQPRIFPREEIKDETEAEKEEW